MSETKEVKLLNETNIGVMFSNYLLENSNATIGAEFVTPVYKLLAESMADAMKVLKQKDAVVGVFIVADDHHQDIKDIIFGVKIQFIPGAEEDAGSWNTTWSFNPNDFEDVTVKYWIFDNAIEPFITKRAVHNRVQFWPAANVNLLLSKSAFTVLFKWLDENAKDDTKVTVRLESIFDASVEVVDGVKIMTFVPDEEITNLAKGDAEI